MAMMASSNPYDRDARPLDSDLIDPDDPDLNDMDDPLQPHQSDRAPLTGNIHNPISQNQNYLTSSIPGEDRRAPMNTLDETVWATLSRDLRAVWRKMRLVLWPNNLLGGVLTNGGGSAGAAERGESDPAAADGNGGIRGLMSRWPVDADTVLKGGVSDDLRDWDLWGPLLFCLLLSLFLSLRAASNQKSLVFSGVFAIVWLGEAVVTVQIKLLGGNIGFFQSVCVIGYTLFPMVIAALLSALHVPVIARVPVFIVLALWSLAAGVSILGGSGVIKNRVGIAVFPLFIYYVGLGCLCIVA